MKIQLLILSLLLLTACSSPTIEDGGSFPTAPIIGTAIIEPTSTIQPTPTLAPTATATVGVVEATAVLPTATPSSTAPVAGEPIRILFDPGATSASLNGHITSGESIDYLAWAVSGQHMHLEIVSPNNVANFSLVGVSDGQPLKRVVNEDRFWDGTLPGSQDYRIMVQTLEDANYTLIVTIDPLGENVLQPVWPIVDATSGFLMGGSHNGQWLDAFAIMPSLQDGERPYQIYSGSSFLGQITASPPEPPLGGPCGGTPAVTLPLDSETSGMMAIVAGWDAAPRQPESLPLDTAVYQEAVAEFLNSEDIDEPEVNLTSVNKIDLEGDGVDEVLIIAARLSGLGNGLPTAAAGDYSLVLLRKIINNVVATIPIAIKVFPEAVELADPVQYNLLAMLDLNGNGILEMVIEGLYYEGRFVTVYESFEGDVQAVLTVGCRL